VIVGTNALGQLRGCEHPIGFNHGTLAMHLLGFNGIEPGALFGQKQGQNTHAFALRFHLEMVFTNEGSDDLAVMPGGVVPDQQPRSFPLSLQLGAAPVQKLRREVAHRTPIYETQRHLGANGGICRSSLPQDSGLDPENWSR
jgi:hypothetical protein